MACSIDVVVWPRCFFSGALLSQKYEFRAYTSFVWAHHVFVRPTFVLGLCSARSTNFVRTHRLYGRMRIFILDVRVAGTCLNVS